MEAFSPCEPPKAPARDEVLIEGFSFDPDVVEVAVGSKVTWRNADPTQHTVTARDGSFGSRPLPNGKGFVVSFDRPGQYAYFCAIHPTMTGTVRVTR